LFAIGLRNLIVGSGSFATTPFHQTINDGKISASRTFGEVVGGFQGGELFRNRTHDELVQRRAVLPSDLLHGPLEGSGQTQRIIAVRHFRTCDRRGKLDNELVNDAREVARVESRNGFGASHSILFPHWEHARYPTMRVIARNTLVAFWSKHPETKVALTRWYT